MPNRVFVVHGWMGSPQSGWLPWLKQEMEQQGWSVCVPAMPHPPLMIEWMDCLSEKVSVADEHCYFVGHSLGCIAILRYLEGLPQGVQVGGVVLIAGFLSHLGFEELSSFFEGRIDFEKIKRTCKRFVAIHSDNDPYVSVHYAELFKEKLGARVIIEPNKKHFSGSDGMLCLPVAREELLRISLHHEQN